jgi:DNA-binding transcriptional regulator YiaG
MEDDMEWEWKGKYKSEIFMVCHMDAKAMYEVGAMSDKDMKKYDRLCFVSFPRKSRGWKQRHYRRKKSGSRFADSAK